MLLARHPAHNMNGLTSDQPLDKIVVGRLRATLFDTHDEPERLFCFMSVYVLVSDEKLGLDDYRLCDGLIFTKKRKFGADPQGAGASFSGS